MSLSEEQKTEIQSVFRDARQRASEVFTPEQREQLREFRQTRREQRQAQ
ncbi:MAG: hypothetical protein HC769_34870 [Cyanobacteria bacterium CRU_2_1]|nr:hypothetical protein [Cyanobacteria bacterium CRU_2_1]